MLTWNVAELSEIFEISKGKVRALIRNGKLKAALICNMEGYQVSDRSLFEFFKVEENAELKMIFMRKLNNGGMIGDKLAASVKPYLKARGYI